MLRLSLLAAALAVGAQADTVTLDWDVENWVVDFMRPTTHLKKLNKRLSPFKIDESVPYSICFRTVKIFN
jgi:hypothetical protein